MTKMKDSAARRRGRLARLLLILYIVSLLMGQACMTASALSTEEGTVLELASVEDADDPELFPEPQPDAEAQEPETQEPQPEAQEPQPEPEAQESQESQEAQGETEDVPPDYDLEDDFVKEPLCGIAEHAHTDSCYEGDVLVCTQEAHTHDEECYPACGIEAHTHISDCYDGDGNLVCGKEEHTHDEIYCYAACGKTEHVHTHACLDRDGWMICDRKRHVHDKGCCPVPPPKEEPEEPLYCGKEEHTHEEACYDENGGLICVLDEHVHDESCYASSEEPQPVETAPSCGKEAHTHGPLCFNEAGDYICTLDEHVHDESCYASSEKPQPEETAPSCGKEAHTHGPLCFNEAGDYICTLDEHVHDESCYASSEEPQPEEKAPSCGKEAHTHGPLCFNEAGDYICTLDEHVHDESCYASPEEKTLYCEKEAHVHSESCDGENGELICGMEAHIHDESCYEKPKILCCGKEAHTHSAECYDENDTLICTLDEHIHDESCYASPEESVTYCGLEEHTHGESCMDENGSILCGKREHVHDESCYVKVYCGYAAHQHDALCLGEDGALICGLEAHTHEESCYLEIPEGMALACGLEPHTHGEGCYDEEGNLTCSLQEHTHTEDCFRPILEGTVYYPIENPSELDPDTAYLIMRRVDDAHYLLSAGPDIQPVAVEEGVDGEGAPCVRLNLEQPTAVMPLALSEAEAAGDPEASEITSDPGTSEITDAPESSEIPGTPEVPETAEAPAELAGELKWVPEKDSPQTLSNQSDSEAQVALSTGDEGLTATVQMDEEPLSLNGIMLFAAGRATKEYKNCPSIPCPFDAWAMWDDPNKVTDDVTNMNPFGEAHAYNLFVLGDFHNYGVTHGNAAIGGNITGHCSGISYDAGSNNDFSANKTESNPVGLLLGGTVTSDANDIEVRNGSILASQDVRDAGRLKMDDLDDDHFHVVSQEALDKYFADAAEKLKAQNASMTSQFNSLPAGDEHLGSYEYLTDANQDVAHDLVGENGQDMILRGSSYEYNVFNIPASKLVSKSGQPRLLFLDIPFGSYTVINVVDDMGGKLPSFAPALRYKDSNGKYIPQPADKSHNDNYKQTQRTIINFADSITEATIDANGLYIFASMMGPNVDMKVTVNSVALQGNIVLGSLSGPEGSSGSVNNATIQNDFEVSGSAAFRKYMGCLSDDVGSCFVDDQNAAKWADYRMDLTLNSTDHVGGEPRVFKLRGLRLDGTLYDSMPTEVNPIGRSFYLAPGDYIVKVEQIYKVDENGNKLFTITDEEGNIVKDENGNDLPTEGRHFLDGAYFIGDRDTCPDRSELEEIAVPKNLILSIAPYVHENKTIVDTYGNNEGTKVMAVKRWVRNDNGQEYIVAPPAGAEVTFELCYQKIDKNGNAVNGGEMFTAPDSWKTVNAGSKWYAVWNSLPKGDGTYTYKYYVKEAMGWDGYSEVTAADEWNFANDKQYSRYYDKNTGQFFIKNREDPAAPGALRVRKIWLDFNGNPLKDTDKETRTATIQLYRQKGGIPADVEKPHTVTITAGEQRYAYPVANGSDLTVNLGFWTNKYQENAFAPVSGDFISVFAEVQGNGMALVNNISFAYERIIVGTIKNITKDVEINLTKASEAVEVYTNNSTGMIVYTPLSATGVAEKYSPNLIEWDTMLQEVPADVTAALPATGADGQPASQASKVTLSTANGWTDRWIDLPTTGTENGETVYYRYYPLEVDATGGMSKYQVSYRVAGSRYDNVTKDQLNGMPGITEGVVRVNNQEMPRSQLPKSGGHGTQPYTLGGLLLTAAALLLMYSHGKRRKEDFASF